ncbi:MAG: hypothetical protein IPJ32_04565 [Sphingobacteriaceae bacterium]|nr:hypothetical protein [Sphingobacteriaceae bacterium]
MKPKGMISVINSNKFFNTEYGKNLRSFLSDYNFLSIINLEQVPVFEEALVSNAIFLITKEAPAPNFKYIKFFKEEVLSLENIKELNKRKAIISQAELKNSSWLFNDNNSNEIINKIKAKGKPLDEIDTLDIKRGITTGFDDAFILDKIAKNELIKSEAQIKDVIKPLLRGKDINKYIIKSADLSLLFIPWHFPLHKDESINVSSEKAEKALSNSFPTLYKHLMGYKNKLSDRNKAETGIRYEWYALQRCANTYYEDFNKDKIAWGLISGHWGFALDEKKHFLTSASFFLTSKVIPLKFLLALFNSNLYRYYFIKVGEYTAGGAYVLKKTSIEKFIIPTISTQDQKPYIALIDKILTAKQENKDTSAYEKKIDSLVYNLFGLSEEEIKITEQPENA